MKTRPHIALIIFPSCDPPWLVDASVYGWERLVLLKHLLEQGLKKTDIAAQLGVSRRLIYHWVKTGQLDRDLDELARPRVRATRPSKLEPYKASGRDRLETYPELSARCGCSTSWARLATEGASPSAVESYAR